MRPPSDTELSPAGNEVPRDRRIHRGILGFWLGTFCLLSLWLLYCFGNLEKARKNLAIDSIILEDRFQTPALNLSPATPPFRGGVILLPAPGQSKELYTFFAEDLAGEGFRVFCLDLPGTGASTQSFSFQSMPAFMEEAYTALLVRNLITPRETALIAFGRSGDLVPQWLLDHQDIKTAVVLSGDHRIPDKNRRTPAALSSHWEASPFFSLLPSIPGRDAIHRQLQQSFPRQENIPSLPSTDARTWWSITLLSALITFPFFLKVLLLFWPSGADTLCWIPFSRKVYLKSFGWILLIFFLAGLFRIQSLQPVGYMSLGALCSLLLLLMPFIRTLRWKATTTTLITFLVPILCFLFLYWLVGFTANQGGLPLRLIGHRWNDLPVAFLLFLPWMVFFETGMFRIRNSLSFVFSCCFALSLHFASIGVWWICGLSPFSTMGAVPFSFLGFPRWELLLLAVVVLNLYAALMREWSRNLISSLLFHTLCLSWLFTAFSIRIL